jgi:tetratricopeptide (TPR) repeat protein
VSALLFVGAGEGALRLAGVEGATDRTTTWFADHILNPPLWNEDRSDVVPGRVWLRRGQAHHFKPFPPVKPSNTFRVAVFGGSAAHGYGVLEPGAFPHRVEQLLQLQYPTVDVQVINMGTIAWSSQQLIWGARELSKLPGWDLVLVYSGHNELLELASWKSYLDPAEHRRFTKTLLLHQRLENLRLFVVGRRILGKKRPSQDGATEGHPDPGLSAGHIGPHQGLDPIPARVLDQLEIIPAEDRARMGPMERRYAARTYTHNVGKLVELFHRLDVPVLIINPAPNDFHDPAAFPRTGPKGERFHALLQKAEEMGTSEQFHEVEKPLREALALFKSPEAYFALAQNTSQMSRRSEGEKYYREARRWAEYPNRVVPEVSEAILAFEGRPGVLAVLDIEEHFRAQDPDRLIDYGLIYDHCHPSAEGSFLIAGEIAKALAGRVGLGDPDPSVDVDAWVQRRRREPIDRTREDPRLWEWSGLTYDPEMNGPVYIADNQGDWQLIRERHEAAVDSPDAAAMDWLWAGNSRFYGYEVDGAMEAWKRARRLDPGLCLAWANEAYALHSLGDRPAALRAIAEAVTCDPENQEFSSQKALLRRLAI